MAINKEVINIIRTAGVLSDYSLSQLRQIYADEYYGEKVTKKQAYKLTMNYPNKGSVIELILSYRFINLIYED